MKQTKLYSIYLCMVFGTLLSSAPIYMEDFSSTTLTDRTIEYVGGWFTPQNTFGQWFGLSTEADLVNEELAITSTAIGFRGAAVVLSPDVFNAIAGEYTLLFDVPLFDPNPDNPSEPGTGFGRVNVWAGSGYDLSESSGSGINVSTQTGNFIISGDAQASLLATTTVNAVGTGYSLSFTYDGFSAIGLFFGAESLEHWPRPVINYDNIIIIPEPGALVFALISLASFLTLLAFPRRK